MTRLRQSCGQAYVTTVLLLTFLLGMSAVVLDVGSWYRAHRALQASMDAAALAGAQALPDDTGTASALASEYASKNGGGLASTSFERTVLPDDTIVVKGERPAPGFFAKVFSLDSITVKASAKARAGVLSQAQYVAPIVVNWQHPKLQCSPPPCRGPQHSTTLELINLHSPGGGGNAAGSFGLIDLRANGGGNPGANELAEWMAKGFDQYMALGDYDAAPSANFNNGQFQDALSGRLNTEVLFPIYKKLTGSGTNAKFEIIGWVGFVPTSFNPSGSQGTVSGYFTRVIWQGVMATSPSATSFGAYAVALIE